MNITILIIEALILAALFTVLVFVNYRGDKKYSAAAIHNYPPDIQEEYFKTHQRVDVSYQSKNVLFTKGLGVLLFTVILTACAYFAGAKTFWQGFAVAFGLMIWIGVYDTFFLDWVLFANMKCFRLPGTEHMDKAYHQKWFHLKGMLFPGVVFALFSTTAPSIPRLKKSRRDLRSPSETNGWWTNRTLSSPTSRTAGAARRPC